MLSSRVGEVTKHFPDIPDLFKFGLSSIQFGAVGVFCCRQLQKGMHCKANWNYMIFNLHYTAILQVHVHSYRYSFVPMHALMLHE